MSYFMYLASDRPLPEVENPHYKSMSINEALAAGIKVADHALDGIDRDKPDVVLWCDIDDDQLPDDDLSIYPIERSEDILTQKKYCACLEWGQCTKGRAERVIAYIREQLKDTEVVEIWHIALGWSDLPRQIKRIRMSIDDLDVQAMEKLYASEGYRSVSVSRPGAVLKDFGIEEDELEVSVQYCYEVVRG